MTDMSKLKIIYKNRTKTKKPNDSKNSLELRAEMDKYGSCKCFSMLSINRLTMIGHEAYLSS